MEPQFEFTANDKGHFTVLLSLRLGANYKT